MLELIINNEYILEVAQESIKYTMQNNDIADLESRQCSFTNSFSIPKTFNNVNYFKQLGLVGDVSDIPYKKVTAMLLENGIPLITNGWLEVKETTTEYKIFIRDGSIDLFKAFENKTFGDHVDLSEIDHSKDLNTIINSFTNENYRYIINDYGGKTHTENGTKINIDYLVPSVPVKYLWDKIFTTFGFNYIGDVFNQEDFKGLWMTFPKGFSLNDAPKTLFADLGRTIPKSTIQAPPTWQNSTITNGSLISNWRFLVPENGSYFLEFNIKFRLSTFFDTDDEYTIIVNGVQKGLFLESNGTQNISLNLINAGDVIEIGFPEGIVRLEESFLKISKYNENISFQDEFKELKITDFFKNILIQFGLTIFIDKDNNYIFKTFNERLQSGVIDWSNKYKERTSETYTPKTYAQYNYFKHKYNDENSNYSDGRFLVNNKNLNDSKTLTDSFLYSGEKDNSFFTINPTHTEVIIPTLLWQKEVNENDDNQKVNYKSLSGRFYFLRYKNISQGATLKSELFGNQQAVSSLPIAQFFMTLYKDFVPKYYSNIELLFNDFRMHKISLALNNLDIHNLDFDKIYYFEQEQNYYILNKLTYESCKLSNAEFYRVKYTDANYCFGFNANNDSVVVDSGESVTINVLANDDYPLGTLTITIITPPQHGVLTINANNTITYLHDGSDEVSDSFEYELNNGTCKDNAIVDISILDYEGCYKLVSAVYNDLDIFSTNSISLEYEACNNDLPLNIILDNNVLVNLNECIKYTPNFGLELDTNITEIEIQNSITLNQQILRNVIVSGEVIGNIKLKFENCN